jgi:hypothetical protein
MRTEQIEGTAWPVDIPDDDNDSVQWKLRYAPQNLNREERLFAASALAAYAALADPVYSQRDAFAMLKRARRARLGPEGATL